MRKGMWKKTGALALVGALLAGSVFVSAPPERVEAASTGTWVLTEEKAFLNCAGLSETAAKEMAEQNGWATVAADLSSDGFYFFVNDGAEEMSTGWFGDSDRYMYENDYAGKIGSNIRFSASGGWYGGSEADETNTIIFDCSVPKESYEQGAKVELAIQGHMTDWVGETEYMSMANGFSANTTGDVVLSDGDGKHSFQVTAYDFYHKYNNEYSVDVTGTMPTNPSVGDKCTIQVSFYAGGGAGSDYYQWIYTYGSGGSSVDDDEDASDLSDLEDDIDVDQVKNLKVVNKKVKRIYASYSKVSDATGYEVQYATKSSFSGAKKLTTKSTKGYFVNKKGKKLTFKKGKTYYVRVRAYAKDSSGDKVYGKWSTAQKVTIKK